MTECVLGNGCIDISGVEYCPTKQSPPSHSSDKDNNMKMCCKALTAECLACEADQSQYEYCKKNPFTQGCPVSNRNISMEGDDKDDHGCIASAGETWCESEQKCYRPWSTTCAVSSTTTSANSTNNSKSPVGLRQCETGQKWCASKGECLYEWEQSSCPSYSTTQVNNNVDEECKNKFAWEPEAEHVKYESTLKMCVGRFELPSQFAKGSHSKSCENYFNMHPSLFNSKEGNAFSELHDESNNLCFFYGELDSNGDVIRNQNVPSVSTTTSTSTPPPAINQKPADYEKDTWTTGQRICNGTLKQFPCINDNEEILDYKTAVIQCHQNDNCQYIQRYEKTDGSYLFYLRRDSDIFVSSSKEVTDYNSKTIFVSQKLYDQRHFLL